MSMRRSVSVAKFCRYGSTSGSRPWTICTLITYRIAVCAELCATQNVTSSVPCISLTYGLRILWDARRISSPSRQTYSYDHFRLASVHQKLAKPGLHNFLGAPPPYTRGKVCCTAMKGFSAYHQQFASSVE